MNMRPLILLMTFSLSATLSADGTDHVEEWKAVVGSMFAEELRRTHRDGFFANDRTDSELDQLISRISSEVASCWANGYLSLAKSKSISIDNVIVVSGGLHIDNRHFTHEEINEAMNHCVPAAFRNAGIEYKSGAAEQYEGLIAFHDRI